MSRPELPRPAPGDVLLVCTFYQDGNASWGGLLNEIGGHQDGDVRVLGDGGVRLRLVADPGWNYLHGGDVPALIPGGGSVPPVVVLVDIPVVSGGDGPLLVDVTAIPGR